jgi:hypothetical protein
MKIDSFLYRYPDKLKKFGIENPGLKILGTKYENEIPWQVEIKNEATFLSYITKILLPDLFFSIDLNANPTSNYFVKSADVDLENALNLDPEINNAEKNAIWQCREKEGDNAAIELLVRTINQKKHKGYLKWWKEINKSFKGNPAFAYLILRSIYDSAKKGTRRILPKPSEEILSWMHIQLTKEKLTPKVHFSKLYFQRLLKRGRLDFDFGWQYIPSGEQNATLLSSSVQGTGWCIASELYAKMYLKKNEFYLLRCEGHSVVALRVDKTSKKVIECQGNQNIPPKEWSWDVHFFTNTIDLKLAHNNVVLNNWMKDHPLKIQSISWWEKRLSILPFAINFHPNRNLKESYIPQPMSLGNCLDFMNLIEIEKKLNKKLPIELLKATAILRPELIELIIENKISPTDYEKLRNQSIEYIKEKVEEMDISLEEIHKLPDFIKLDPTFQEALSKHLPTGFKQLTQQQKGRNKRFKSQPTFDEIIPASNSEPVELALQRAISIILNNPTSDFSDRIFSEELKKHSEFKTIRTKAWAEAVKENPTCFFALPLDLRKKKIIEPESGLEKVALLSEWIPKIIEKPWVLTQKNTVPKSIRYHKCLLHAYLQGWEPKLRENPLNVELKIGAGYHQKKVYLALPALCVHSVFHSIVIGFQRNMSFHAVNWRIASKQLRSIPVMQLAVLMSATNTASEALLYGYLPSLYSSAPDPNKDDLFVYFIYLLLTGKGQQVTSAYYSPDIEKNFGFFPLPKLSKEEKLLLKKL